MDRVLILNGSNLNLLGVREPDLYGTGTLADIEATCRTEAPRLGMEIDFRQSNHEGVLVDWMHEALKDFSGVVINAGAYARTSLALLDAVKAVKSPVIEVHMTNIYQRESYRPASYLSYGAVGVVSGFGAYVYPMGMMALRRVLDERRAAPVTRP